MIEDAIRRIQGNLVNKDKIKTEEATKNALVLPFIAALGYNVFDPLEVIPEFTTDVGTKKGEKVDYCIQINGNPTIIIECKRCTDKLRKYSSQLYRYFTVSNARFGVYTNGIIYKFYSDIEKPNLMDNTAFLEIDIEKPETNDFLEIQKFHKDRFDVKSILNDASEMIYKNKTIEILDSELKEPSEDFIKHFASKVHDGRTTAKVISQFEEILKDSIKQVINKRLQLRLQIAEKKETEEIQDNISNVSTTEEEIEAFHIVKAILCRAVNPSRIVHRDTQSYFGILLDDNNRKPICRLWLESKSWYIGLFHGDVIERKSLGSIDEIYNYSKELKKTIDKYDPH